LADIEEPEDSPKGYMTIFRPEYRRRTLFVARCLEAIYPSELFPTGVRATANGFATGASRVGAAIGVYGAPHLLDYSVQLTMLVGAGVAGLGWLVTMLLAPETNGKLLTESSAVSPPATVRAVKSPVVVDGGRAEAAL
jgi:hypothetical protein